MEVTRHDDNDGNRNEGGRRTEEFLALLESFDLKIFDLSASSIYGLWPDLTLSYVNAGWRLFAQQNGGEPTISREWPLGCSILDAISEPLRPYYLTNFRRCLRELRPWQHAYECSSAERKRWFQVTSYPLGDAQGLLVVHSLRQDTAQTQPEFDPLDSLYRDPRGVITQCSHCRRVRRTAAMSSPELPRWDWVPAWVRRQPRGVSHGLCEHCFDYYYLQHGVARTEG